ncbi:MAG: hypothetical protein GXP08_05030 [Gammaproteobacteria bacterium]|nr:hypothetical protein [Gammaproteobacteria bacterium]
MALLLGKKINSLAQNTSNAVAQHYDSHYAKPNINPVSIKQNADTANLLSAPAGNTPPILLTNTLSPDNSNAANAS